ncbi:hypothetical protein [Aquiflexum sp.]|uniref:hypothetical protein n=1 Tax=Aquiflexum sp. TaxID=1872584 RepID=UPI003593FCFE
MKKKMTLKKVTIAAGVVAMSVGLFNSFDSQANEGCSGLCCKLDDESCYHPNENKTYADSEWKSGLQFCP